MALQSIVIIIFTSTAAVAAGGALLLLPILVLVGLTVSESGVAGQINYVNQGSACVPDASADVRLKGLVNEARAKRADTDEVILGLIKSVGGYWVPRDSTVLVRAKGEYYPSTGQFVIVALKSLPQEPECSISYGRLDITLWEWIKWKWRS